MNSGAPKAEEVKLTELNVNGVKARSVQDTAERRVRVHALRGCRDVVSGGRLAILACVTEPWAGNTTDCLLAPLAWERMRLTNAA